MLKILNPKPLKKQEDVGKLNRITEKVPKTLTLSKTFDFNNITDGCAA